MPQSSRSATPRIRRITTIGEWRVLQPQWDAMLAGSRSDAVFLCWDWIDVWLDVYGGGGRWFILVAENESGELLGAAPMMIVRPPSTVGRWIRRLTLIGQEADTASEYLDWIARRDVEGVVTAAFAHHLFRDMRSEWDLIDLSFVREDAALLPALRAAFEESAVSPLVEFQTHAPYLELPASWDDFLAARRSKFRSRWNKFHRDHAVALRFGGTDMSVADGMALIRELHHKRWRGASSSFTSERYIRFHDHVAARLHACGRLLLVFLELDGQIVAGRYDFVHGGKGWCFQGGWLPEWEKQSAGKMLIAGIIEWCIGKGLREYDFLGGTAGYKDDWTDARRTLVTMTAANPGSWRGRLYTKLRQLARVLRGKQARRAEVPAAPCATDKSPEAA